MMATNGDGDLQANLAKQPVQDQRAAEVDEQRRQPEQFLVGRKELDDELREHPASLCLRRCVGQLVEVPVRVAE
jgi:hypothetical protein